MKRKRLSEAMETLDFMQKPIELATSSQLYLRSLWEAATEIQKSYASLTSVFSSIFNTLSSFLVQEAILNMAVYELAFNRLTFLPDYGFSVRTTAQPEQENVPLETAMPSSPVFNVLLVKKLISDLARRIATHAPRMVAPSRAETEERKTPPETAEAPTGEHAKPEPMQVPFQTIAQMRSQLESSLAPTVKSLASALRTYSGYAVSLPPLPLFLGLGGPETVRQLPSVLPIEEGMPTTEHAEPLPTATSQSSRRQEAEEVKPSFQESITHKRPIPEVFNPVRQVLELPAIVSQREADAMSNARFAQALSLPSQLSVLIEEISPSLASWVYGESEALRSTGLSLSAVPVAASTAQRIVTEALIEPVSGVEGPETLERGVPFRLPSVFTSLVATHSRNYSPFYAEPSVGEAYALPSQAETPYRGQAPKEGALLEETSVSRLPSVIALAAAESLIAQKLRHEMTAFAKDVQAAQSTYGESLATMGATGPARATKLGELASAPNFPVPIEPYAPPVSSTPPPPTRPRLVDRAIRDTINVTVSAESQEEDLRELERKISKILAEQLSRYYGSTRI